MSDEAKYQANLTDLRDVLDSLVEFAYDDGSQQKECRSPDVIRAYEEIVRMFTAATISQQAEWPSDADVHIAFTAFRREKLSQVDGFMPSISAMRVALQSVRPPAVVVSDEPLLGVVWNERTEAAHLIKRGTEDEFCAKYGCRRLFLASRHARQVPDVASLKDLIRGFGYTTQSQSWDLAEAVIRMINAAPPAPEKD